METNLKISKINFAILWLFLFGLAMYYLHKIQGIKPIEIITHFVSFLIIWTLIIISISKIYSLILL